MARRTEDLTIVDRDETKVFRLTEMSAWAAEKWAARALLALMKSGVDVPENITSAGLSGIAAMGIKAFGGITPEVLMPLMDEMMSCVQIIPDPRHPMPRKLVEEDIEDVSTLLTLRKHLLDLHLGFSLAAKLSTFSALAADNLLSKNTSTSPLSSE